MPLRSCAGEPMMRTHDRKLPPTAPLECRRLAARRQQIRGVERMLHKLRELDYLRNDLRDAADGLRALLGIAELAEAFAQFQAEGGTTVDDWQRWLAGESPSGGIRAVKQRRHLRHIEW
jgi:hypothetical protein